MRSNGRPPCSSLSAGGGGGSGLKGGCAGTTQNQAARRGSHWATDPVEDVIIPNLEGR